MQTFEFMKKWNLIFLHIFCQFIAPPVISLLFAYDKRDVTKKLQATNKSPSKYKNASRPSIKNKGSIS